MIFRCLSGSTVDFSSTASLRASRVTVLDIARGLAKINRFAGQTPVPYSVAQHSVLVGRLLTRRYGNPCAGLVGLLHDAHEAFMSDIPKPAKNWMDEGAGAVSSLEKELDDMICASLGVGYLPDYADTTDVKGADEEARRIEGEFLFNGTPHELLTDSLLWCDAERLLVDWLNKLIPKANSWHSTRGTSSASGIVVPTINGALTANTTAFDKISAEIRRRCGAIDPLTGFHSLMLQKDALGRALSQALETINTLKNGKDS